VALRTLLLGNRGMGHVKDDASAIGAMGVVAGNAVLIRHRIIHVGPFESEFFSLMALNTKGRRFSFQQEIRFGRCMGIMAVEATFSLVQGSVLESNLAELNAHILVAVKAKFTACFCQDVSVIRPMGSVTGGALALDHCLMGAAPVLWKHILVAIVAKLGGVGDQQAFVRRCVSNMAAGTLPFFQEWVDISLLENFLEVFMTFKAGGSSGAGLELEGVCRVGWWCNQDKQAQEAE
jgi:hypothetical protein